MYIHNILYIYIYRYKYIYIYYACMHYDICIMYTIRIQMRVLQQFVQSGKCGKTSQLTAGCDSVNASLRAKKWFAEFTEMIWNGN